MTDTLSASSDLKSNYDEQGYFFPLQCFADDEVAYFRAQYFDYHQRHRAELNQLAPKDQYAILSETHTSLLWVYRMATHPRVLDAVSRILGPNLLIWGSRWFTKMPGDKTYISWHQDATYWGLHPPDVTTAWIALSDSFPENGCMRVVPGTHKAGILPQTETYAPDNALSRGQEISVEVNESEAVDVVLHAGEMSLHHIGIVHGSNVNRSQHPRIGLAVRYVNPAVVQEGERSLAVLARGRDEFGHFDLVDPPREGATGGESAQSEAVRRMQASVMRRPK